MYLGSRLRYASAQTALADDRSLAALATGG